jgi:hypothetical protein
MNKILVSNSNQVITLDDITDKSNNKNNQKHYCCKCSTEIPQERIEGLIVLGKPEFQFDCIKCAELSVRKVKGFYQDLSGVSKLNIVNDLAPEQHLVPEEEKDEVNESCLGGEEFFCE